MIWQRALWAVLGAAAAAADVGNVWGTYRPQVYLGLRPRVPESVLTGLAYIGARSVNDVQFLRHTTQDDDGVRYYRWTHHDGHAFGIQEIVDDALNYRLETSFVKSGSASQPGSWAVRVQGTVLDESKPAALTLLYYLGRESSEAELELVVENDEPIVRGSHPALGEFALRLGADGRKTHYAGLRVPTDEVWRVKEPLLTALAERVQTLAMQGVDVKAAPAQELLQLPDASDAQATLYVLQRSFTGNFTLDIFLDGEARGARLDSEQLSVALAHRREAYEEAFLARFPLAGFADEDVAIARELTAQIVGGIGYYAGSSLVDRRPVHDESLVLHEPSKAQPTREPPGELLTATPSRSFFPRGFYWDEGFHQAHVAAWDPSLAMELFESWTRLIDEDGWVAREQILGAEARSRVPEEFQVQFPQFANPPALIMGLTAYLQQLPEDAAGGVGSQATFQLANASQVDLASLYEPWRRHYEWFRRTQRGQIHQWDRRATSKREAYRWRGRSATHVLTSGLDDYPRAATPHIGELHLDLHAWMGAFARAMREFATRLGLHDDAEEYRRHYDAIRANLYDLHWNEKEGMFCDASVDDDDESYFECHRGYVSLFPLLMELLEPDAPALGKTLELIGDPKHLWSPHGVRSLSTEHPLYGSGEDYWRSAVWIPINYLALRALHHYAAAAGPYQSRAQELYADLRQNVIRTVLDEYKRTGYTWEQYDAATGVGRRNRPFAGWTSMVVLIMAEKYT
ncbi:mannosyl-oligosaccharide glucosidase [Malassezia obtusa]|uniref:Mannosyl-oligosaccharide glucosidase n=1 Tax=Malassezia obtusa TaxID=76774 RepID=A0AAF0DYV2_9BASI|nr:mannosyl-oligosaccharide glucosidase [Malassezia obtusa]